MAELPTLELHDIGEVDDVGRALPDWDLSSVQLEPGSLDSFHHQLVFDDLTIMHFRESHAAAYEYQLPPDTTAVCLFTPASPLQRWCGLEVPRDVSLIHPSGRDFLSSYPAGFNSIGMVISNATLDELEILPERWLPDHQISTRCLVPMAKAESSFTNWLFRVFESKKGLSFISRDPVESTLFRERVVEGLGVLLRECSASRHRPARSPLRRYGLTRRALDLIDHKLTERLSTRDIAAELRISPRNLQYAFKDVLQTSPYHFVLNRKLHAVRNELLVRSSDENTVSAAAMKYGFTELGRFSGRYRRMFGELPSVTARRNR